MSWTDFLGGEIAVAAMIFALVLGIAVLATMAAAWPLE
jgi:hypothetical protein